MARVKRGVTAHAKHKKVLKAAKGYYGRRKNTIRIAKQAVEKALQYGYSRPQAQEAHLPRPVDPAHQRGGARARPDLRAIYRRPEQGRHRGRPQGAGRHRCQGRSGLQGALRAGGRPGEEGGLSCHPGISRSEISGTQDQKRREPCAGFRLSASCRRHASSMARCGRDDRCGCAMTNNADIASLESTLLAEIGGAGDLRALEEVRISALGKKGRVSELMATLGKHGARAAQGVRAGRERPQGSRQPGAGGQEERPGAPRAVGSSRHREGRHYAALFGWGRCRTGASIRSARCGTRWPRSSATWVSPSPRGRTSRPTTSTSPSSTSRPSTRPGRTTTRSISIPRRMARACCCGRTPAPCRSAPC